MPAIHKGSLLFFRIFSTEFAVADLFKSFENTLQSAARVRLDRWSALACEDSSIVFNSFAVESAS